MHTARDAADQARLALGFLSIAATVALAAREIIICDPYSTMIGPNVRFGTGIILWPHVVLSGAVIIGDGVEIGADGGFSVFGDRGTICIGADARLSGGGTLSRDNDIGAGAQILGAIQVRDCRLEAGSSWRGVDPDQRGGVLKGAGVAHGLHVPRGQVIQAFGLFAEARLCPQSAFHPKPI